MNTPPTKATRHAEHSHCGAHGREESRREDVPAIGFSIPGRLLGLGEQSGLKVFPTWPMSAVMAHEVSEQTLQYPPDIEPLNGKVLVVDDDERFRGLARAVLEPAGFEVIEAGGIVQSMLQLRQQAVDAVILDMVMPGRDGIESVRELKQLFPEIRIVAVSGAKQSALYLSVSAHLGADASLEKARVSALGPLLQLVLDR